MDVIGQITAGGLLDGWGLLIIFVGSFLAGFVDAIAGGGGLISVPAFLFAGVPIHFTIGTNKLASAMGTALATFKYMRKGFMLAKLCVPCVIVALVASSIGANVSMLTSENVLRVVMLIIIPLAGFYVLKKKDLGQHERLENFAKTLALCLVVSLVVGFYDGFYGPGTGTFLMLLLTGVAHLSLDHAAGVTKCVNLTTNVSALCVFALGGTCLFALGFVAGCFNLLGSYFGSSQYTEKGAAIARPIMLVVLVVFAIKLVAELLGF